MITITPTVSFHVWRKGHTYQVQDTPDVRAAITKGRLRQLDAPTPAPAPNLAPDLPEPSEPPTAAPVDAPTRKELMRRTRDELVAIVEDLDMWTPDGATKSELVDTILAAGPPT